MRLCIINVGLYRTGSATLAKAAAEAGFSISREFPVLTERRLKMMLLEPEQGVLEWWSEKGGEEELYKRIESTSANENKCSFIGDGYISFLPLLPKTKIDDLRDFA